MVNVTAKLMRPSSDNVSETNVSGLKFSTFFIQGQRSIGPHLQCHDL